MAKITVTGNLVYDPKFFAGNKTPFTSARLAETPRRFDKQLNEWVDSPTTWYDLKLFGANAETFIEAFKKGDRVLIVGDMETEQYTRSDDEKGTKLVITVHNFGSVPRKKSTTATAQNSASVEFATDPVADAWEVSSEAVPF